MQAHRLGVTRACGLVGISRSLYRYQPQQGDKAAASARLVELAADKRRYGYRRLHVLLRREGVADQPQAYLPAVPRCRTHGAATQAQTHRASRTTATAQADPAQRELVDGLRGRRSGQWPSAAVPDDRR